MTGAIGVTAKDMMVTSLRTVRADQRVSDAVKLLLKYSISGVPVIDEKHHLVGVISEKDCIRALMRAVHDRLPPSLVQDVMSTDPITITEDTHLLTVAHHFLTKPIRRLPVVDNGRLVGQISRRDLLRSASRVFDIAPDRDTAVLYLSALERRPPPSWQA